MADEPLPQALLDLLPDGEWFTIPQIATFLEIRVRVAYRLASNSRFKTFRPSSGMIRVWRGDFIEYLQRHRRWSHKTKE